jgi:hypothetical protein
MIQVLTKVRGKHHIPTTVVASLALKTNASVADACSSRKGKINPRIA